MIDLLYKMIVELSEVSAVSKSSNTEFRYLPVSSFDSKWGLAVHTVGVSRIAANRPYPPVHHPAAYSLDWTHGRTLQEFQIIYISEGRGWLEERGGTTEIGPGDAFLLRRGVWHRYRPDPETGWQEHWVGFDGAWVRRQIRQGCPGKRHLHVQLPDERPVAAAFHALQQLSSTNLSALQQVLAGYTLTLLGLLVSANRPRLRQSEEGARIEEAMDALSGPDAASVDLLALAAQLNLSYSRFRSIFKERLGISPHQFRIHHKLSEARDLLRTTDKSVKEVCSLMGFSSEQYFCKLFREHVGFTPGQFRRLRTREGTLFSPPSDV